MVALKTDENPYDQDTKTKIFSTAARLFSAKGFHGVSMREISEKAGVTKPTIYYYFGSKEGIYKELIDVGIRYITENSQKVLELDTSIKNKLIVLIQNTFQQCLAYPEFAKFFLYLLDSSEKLSFLDDFKVEAMRFQKVLSRLIKEGIKTGEFGVSARPELAAEIIIGVFLHFVMKQLNTEKKILSKKFAEEIIELLFKGLNE